MSANPSRRSPISGCLSRNLRHTGNVIVNTRQIFSVDALRSVIREGKEDCRRDEDVADARYHNTKTWLSPIQRSGAADKI